MTLIFEADLIRQIKYGRSSFYYEANINYFLPISDDNPKEPLQIAEIGQRISDLQKIVIFKYI